MSQSDPAPQPVPFRSGGFAPGLSVPVSLTVLGCLVALWWLATALHWVNDLALPPPGEVLGALAGMATSGELAEHLGASLRRLAIGWLIGAIAGIAAGLAIGLFTVARSALLPVISAMFPIPKIALLPLFILWLGIGEASKIATIALGVFPPIAIAVFGGVDAVDRSLIRMAQGFGLPFRHIVWKIILPGALPGLLSGLRISASIAIILLTAAEMIGAEKGIGALVLSAGNLMQTQRLLAGVLILAALGTTVAGVLGLAERRLLRWRG